MKTKVSLLIVFALFMFVGLQAQTEYSFVGGLNLANFSGDDIDDIEDDDVDVASKIGAHVGIAASMPLSKAFDIRGEVALSMNGSVWEYEDFMTFTHSMYVVQAPVSAIFNIPLPKSKIKPYVGGGLSLGMPVYSHWSQEFDDADDGDDDDGDYDDLNLDLSQFVLGYQLNFGASFNQYFFELRVDKSVTPVLDEKRIDEIFYSNTKLLFGYRF